MKVLKAIQMKDVDAYTIKHEPISPIELMERAASKLSEAIARRWDRKNRIIVFAGPGNNGGDALAVARMLGNKGYHVEAYLFNTGGKLSEDCQTNKVRLSESSGIQFTEVTSQFDPPALTAEHLIVDGLFGTGLSKPLNGGFASLVKFINASGCPVVSLDIPSGLMCEDNSFNVRAHIVRATVTLTLQLPKLAFYLTDNASYIGEMEILPIGLHPNIINDMVASYTVNEPKEMRALLRPRDPFGHKGTFGHGLLIAGSFGMAGAAILAAKACLRSGVGKLTIHTPLGNNDILQVAIPEAVLHHDTDERMFTFPVNTTGYNAVAIGPGLGCDRETSIAFIEQIQHAQVPLVIDADGLNILAEHKGWIQQVPKGSVLTPHPRELERITGTQADSYTALHKARELAIHQQLFVIVKGHYTAICTPQGHTYFNNSGNSGMATAGSGDVLTGILLGLLATGYPTEDACRLGVYLHGLAGDIAAKVYGEESMTASDLLQVLPQAFIELRKQ